MGAIAWAVVALVLIWRLEVRRRGLSSLLVTLLVRPEKVFTAETSDPVKAESREIPMPMPMNILTVINRQSDEWARSALMEVAYEAYDKHKDWAAAGVRLSEYLHEQENGPTN